MKRNPAYLTNITVCVLLKSPDLSAVFKNKDLESKDVLALRFVSALIILVFTCPSVDGFSFKDNELFEWLLSEPEHIPRHPLFPWIDLKKDSIAASCNSIQYFGKLSHIHGTDLFRPFHLSFVLTHASPTFIWTGSSICCSRNQTCMFRRKAKAISYICRLFMAALPPTLHAAAWIMKILSPVLSFTNPSAADTPSSLCCIPWEWLGNCWLSMQRCRLCRRQACTLSLSPTSTTSLLITTPSSFSSWSPTFPVSEHADFYWFLLLWWQ